MAETRNEAQEPSGNPWAPNLDEAGGPTGNRAAVGAREADSPQAAGSGWTPGPGATDFLGLEPDVRGGSGASGPTESWLFDIEHADGGSANEPARAGATATQGAADESDDHPTDAETSDADLEPELAPARSRSRRVLVGAALIAVLAAGSWYGYDQYFRGSDLAPEIASVAPKPAPKPASKPASKPAETTSAPVATTAAEPAVDSSPTPEPIAATEPAPPVASVPEPVVVVAPPPTDVVASTPTEPLLERSPDAAQRSPILPTGEPGPGGGRHATARDFAGMWLEPTIPTDAIGGATRLRTLNVGLVRAELVNGEFVEGALHAVGESRIWLDVELGRMSLSSADVRDLVQIVGSQGQPIPLGTETLANLPRVEVLLPGGTLVGRVLGREGDRVTFVTEDGMRMRVDALDVRPAPNGRSRLIGPVAARKP